MYSVVLFADYLSLVKGMIWEEFGWKWALFRLVEWTPAVTQGEQDALSILWWRTSMPLCDQCQPPASPSSAAKSLSSSVRNQKVAALLWLKPRPQRTHRSWCLPCLPRVNLGARDAGKWRKLIEKWAGQWNWCVSHGKTSVEQVKC